MYNLLKPILFAISPEKAHKITMSLLGFAAATAIGRFFLKWFFHEPTEPVQIMGLKFPNKIGLAAGFDKDGKHIPGLSALGFGFIEVGTVTPVPQAGNPAPRLFRLPADEALINRMGFNNEGAEALALRLKSLREKGAPNGVIIGGNIGKNKNTANEDALKDYEICFEKLFPYVDYFVVNVSSPNTPGLRALQEKEPLKHLLAALMHKNQLTGAPKPLLLKIAPDLTDSQLDDVADIVQETRLDGVIATNTTIERGNLQTPPARIESIGNGGLSGLPLQARSTAVVAYLRKKLEPSKIIIGVGGIDSPQNAREKLDAGADLIQIYSGMVYKGPGLIKNILKHLKK